MPTKESKNYSSFKKKEYAELYRKAEQYLTDLTHIATIERLANQAVRKHIKGMSNVDLNNITIYSKEVNVKLMSKVNLQIMDILRSRFNICLKRLWKLSYELGVKHTIYDMLYQIKPFRVQFDKLGKGKTISNLMNTSNFSALTDVIENRDIAEFNSPTDAERINNAKRLELILRANLQQYKSEGGLNYLPDSPSIANYMTLEDKVRFYETIGEIYDFRMKAEASRESFLADTYMQNRYRVLSNDYSKKADTRVKELIYEYLNEDIASARQVRDNLARTDDLTFDIFKVLNRKRNSDRISNAIRSEKIVRTELNLAYNVGKLSGYTSPFDMGRKFQWNASWELEGKNGTYEVCDACAAMDGRLFTVQEILFAATQVDRGILNYRGNTRTTTSFKDPTLPVISYHPFCECYWTLYKDYSRDSESEDIELENQKQNLISLDELKDQRLNSYELNNIYQQPQGNAVLESALAVAGTALTVGGIFLLARSNVWRTFFNTTKQAMSNPTVRNNIVDTISDTVVNPAIPRPVTEVVNSVDEVVQYVDNVDNQVPIEIVNTLKSILNDLPELT